jgi:hypothetical protein
MSIVGAPVKFCVFIHILPPVPPVFQSNGRSPPFAVIEPLTVNVLVTFNLIAPPPPIP